MLYKHTKKDARYFLFKLFFYSLIYTIIYTTYIYTYKQTMCTYLEYLLKKLNVKLICKFKLQIYQFHLKKSNSGIELTQCLAGTNSTINT